MSDFRMAIIISFSVNDSVRMITLFFDYSDLKKNITNYTFIISSNKCDLAHSTNPHTKTEQHKRTENHPK